MDQRVISCQHEGSGYLKGYGKGSNIKFSSFSVFLRLIQLES